MEMWMDGWRCGWMVGDVNGWMEMSMDGSRCGDNDNLSNRSIRDSESVGKAYGFEVVRSWLYTNNVKEDKTMRSTFYMHTPNLPLLLVIFTSNDSPTNSPPSSFFFSSKMRLPLTLQIFASQKT